MWTVRCKSTEGEVVTIVAAANHVHVCVLVAEERDGGAGRCAACQAVAGVAAVAGGSHGTPAGHTLHLQTTVLAALTRDDLLCVCGERLRPALLRQTDSESWSPLPVTVDPNPTTGPYLGITLSYPSPHQRTDDWPAAYHVLANGIVTHNSSFAAAVRRRTPGTHVFPEPVTTNPFLPSFYRDPRRYALPLQLWMFEQRAITYRRALCMLQGMQGEGGGVVLDRSVWSDWTFAAAVRDDGHLTDHQMQQYLTLRRRLGRVMPRLETVVALEVEPTEALRRIREVRRRPVEAGISLAYLSTLQRHLDTFVQQDAASGLAPYAPVVHRLDWSTFGEGVTVPPLAPLTDGAAAALAAFRPGDADDILADLARLREQI